MKTIIAEKPSVAREIARIVGATKREEGYFEGGGYAVTWAFGHLVQLAMPDGYGVRGFVRDNLPIIPDTFTLVPRQVRTEKGYKPDSGVVCGEQRWQDQRGYKESERAVAERSDQPEGRPPATAAGEAAEENGQGHEDVIRCPPLNPKYHL